jgi:oxygen-independent coproporphyrinogen-3 oxidase
LPLALYVAWPAEDAGLALRRALDRALAALPGGVAGRRLVSVLIDAAGTPPPGAVRALLDHTARQFVIAPDLEVTLAIDPRAVHGLAAWRGAGITRLALRAEALDAALATLAAAGTAFASTAVDLSFGRSGQTLADWGSELAQAVRAGADHLSIEEHAAGRSEDADHMATLYQGACDALRAAGLPPYEIGHFAKPGHESRHLLHGATGGDYLGIGPGAVGRITHGRVCHALHQAAPAAAWLASVEHGTEGYSQLLSPDQRRTELVLTGLRLCAGIERAWFEPRVGRLESAVDGARLTALVEDGFLVLDQRGLRLTERGWPLCDAVLARLLD